MFRIDNIKTSNNAFQFDWKIDFKTKRTGNFYMQFCNTENKKINITRNSVNYFLHRLLNTTNNNPANQNIPFSKMDNDIKIENIDINNLTSKEVNGNNILLMFSGGSDSFILYKILSGFNSNIFYLTATDNNLEYQSSPLFGNEQNHYFYKIWNVKNINYFHTCLRENYYDIDPNKIFYRYLLLDEMKFGPEFCGIESLFNMEMLFSFYLKNEITS